MRHATSSDHHFTWNWRRMYPALLSLLLAATIGMARQAPAGSTRRASATSQIKMTQLPQPATSSAVSVEQALTGLASLSVPGNERLDLAKISQLAWAIQGAVVAAGTGPAGTVPTEVAAMKVYFALPDGVYAYDPAVHALQQVEDKDVRQTLAAGLLNQTGAPVGGCQIVLAASVAEFNKRYGTRAREVMLLQAGRMSQSLQLEAIAQGLTFVSVDGPDSATVRRAVRAVRSLDPVYAAFVGYPAGQAPSIEAGRTANATALLVVPPQQFQDEELLVTRRALEQAGVQVVVASTRMGQLLGMLGGTVRADRLLNQVKPDNYNALVFIGGNGVLDYLNNPIVLKLVRQAATQRKVLAAIGTAPSILANAGVLKGARATAYVSEQARLVQGGALYTGNAAEKDGLTVTAVGPIAAGIFAKGIVDAIGEAGQTTAAPTTK